MDQLCSKIDVSLRNERQKSDESDGRPAYFERTLDRKQVVEGSACRKKERQERINVLFLFLFFFGLQRHNDNHQ